MADTATAVRLKPQTILAFAAYVRKAEASMEKTLKSDQFLWCETDAPVREKLRAGNIVAEFWSGKEPAKVPGALIHDWIGAVLVPSTTLAHTLALVQDYDNHKIIYSPEVVDSKLISRDGNHFRVYLRLLKKKIVSVTLDTYHDVHYLQLDSTRWSCRSHSTKVAEVENASQANERVLPPDTGHGFLWRLYSYWRFQQNNHGVFVECRAISLTRDIPFGLGWIVEPIVQNLPRESLINTLEATRRALRRE